MLCLNFLRSCYNYNCAFFLIIFLLPSCCPLSENISNKLYYNQNKQDVVQIMGKPDSTKAFFSKEYYVYYLYSDLYDLVFSSDKFPFIGVYPLLRTGKEFWVVFEGDKVISFGYKKNFDEKLPRSLVVKSTVPISIDN